MSEDHPEKYRLSPDRMTLVNLPCAKDLVKKYPELKLSDLEILKNWLEKQPHLPQMPDSELAMFLHSKYYQIEPAKTTIDTFFTVKTHNPEFLLNRDPLCNKELREIMNVLFYLRLQSTTPEGYEVVCGKMMDFEPAHFSFIDQWKLFSMVVELSLYKKSACPGHVIVLDGTGIVLGHIARMNPVVIKNVIHYLQESLPIRLKALHVINSSPFMDKVFSLCRPFLKKDLVDVLFFHTSLKTLEDKFPIDILPNEHGGKAGPVEDLWAAQLEELKEHRAWFLEQDTRKSNEALRPKEADRVSDAFGVDGSFKKLEID